MSSLSDQDCFALLRAHPRGHPEAQRAFAALFERYQHRLLCHLQAEQPVLCDADLVEACQETWLRAWRSWSDKIQAGKFRAWLCRIGTNIVIDMLRAGERSKHVALPDGELPSSQPAHTHQLAFAERLRHCLGELPPTHRDVALRLMDLQNYDDIAEQIHIPKTRLYQIKLEAGRLLMSCMEKEA